VVVAVVSLVAVPQSRRYCQLPLFEVDGISLRFIERYFVELNVLNELRSFQIAGIVTGANRNDIGIALEHRVILGDLSPRSCWQPRGGLLELLRGELNDFFAPNSRGVLHEGCD
jgi:hypothetical protein